jgi:hypothetical protein
VALGAREIDRIDSSNEVFLGRVVGSVLDRFAPDVDEVVDLVLP